MSLNSHFWECLSTNDLIEQNSSFKVATSGFAFSGTFSSITSYVIVSSIASYTIFIVDSFSKTFPSSSTPAFLAAAHLACCWWWEGFSPFLETWWWTCSGPWSPSWTRRPTHAFRAWASRTRWAVLMKPSYSIAWHGLYSTFPFKHDISIEESSPELNNPDNNSVEDFNRVSESTLNNVKPIPPSTWSEHALQFNWLEFTQRKGREN